MRCDEEDRTACLGRDIPNDHGAVHRLSGYVQSHSRAAWNLFDFEIRNQSSLERLVIEFSVGSIREPTSGYCCCQCGHPEDRAFRGKRCHRM